MKPSSNIYWILAALVAALFCRTFLISVYKIPTVSMAPTFWPGDFIISSQVSYGLRFPWSKEVYFKSPPKRGDLIVFQFDPTKAPAKAGAQYVKRIVGLPGDVVEIQNGHLLINGAPCTYEKVDKELSVANFELFDETCFDSKWQIILSKNPENQGALANFAKLQLDADQYFVLGDNRDTSDDSRDLGPIRTDHIASKVYLIWLSYGSTQDFISGPNAIRWNRILTKPQ